MKFSIRDLFLVTMIVALAVGWWLDRTMLVKNYERILTPSWENKPWIWQRNSPAPAPNATKP